VPVGMFKNCVAFNQPLITNGDKWNVENVILTNEMFYGAVSFKQTIASWRPITCSNMVDMFGPGSTTPNAQSVDMNEIGTTTNYDALLNAWGNTIVTSLINPTPPIQQGDSLLRSDVTFSGGASKFSSNPDEALSAANSRNNGLRGFVNWQITDGCPLGICTP
jgi:hypothetical protein